MQPNHLNRSHRRTALVWCLLALWLVGSVQASVHSVLMAGETAQPTVAAALSHDASPAEALDEAGNHSYSEPSTPHVGHSAFAKTDTAPTPDAHLDAQCVELCLLMSLAPISLSLSQARPQATLFAQPLGVPAGLTQPAVPPPRPPAAINRCFTPVAKPITA